MAKNVVDMKPYALTAENSRGRAHAEELPRMVDPFALDRQRVLHATAFRRLEYKTQVFVTGVHDHYRTRLTHTLEVASVARRLCTALQVNVSVGELIALAHDLGHPPFGHAGEVALCDLMKDHGSFEHNSQSLRVIEYLEHPYPAFRGLNLSYEVRESLAKHSTIYDKPGAHPLADGTQAPIEGQIANLADRVAYDCHDLEDSLEPGLITERDLQGLDLWREAADEIRKQYPDLPLGAIRRPVLDKLEQMMLDDIVSESRRRLARVKVESVDDVRSCGKVLIALSVNMESRIKELEAFLLERVYHHPMLIRMDSKAARFIQQLFDAYLTQPRMLPPRFMVRMAEQGAHRVACDYIAGMTDRFCQDEYKRLFEPFERV
jgi:dGTPase